MTLSRVTSSPQLAAGIPSHGRSTPNGYVPMDTSPVIGPWVMLLFGLFMPVLLSTYDAALAVKRRCHKHAVSIKLLRPLSPLVTPCHTFVVPTS